MKFFIFLYILFFSSTIFSTEFKFVDNVDFSVDLMLFANQNQGNENDSLFNSWYFLETNTNFDVDFFHYGDFSLFFEYQINALMGQTAGNVVFDPMFSDYGINPFLEYRFNSNKMIAQLGIDHHCFHEIDRHIVDVVLWNKPFFAIGSANKRLSKYRKTVLKRKTLRWNNWGFDDWKFEDRFSWFVKFGYFAKTVMGMGEPTEVNYNNPNVAETEADLRFAIAEYEKTVVIVFTKSKIGYYDYNWHKDIIKNSGSGAYYSSKFGMEFHFLQGKHGFLLFTDYNIDNLPLYSNNYPKFSKNGLVEFGFRFYN